VVTCGITMRSCGPLGIQSSVGAGGMGQSPTRKVKVMYVPASMPHRGASQSTRAFRSWLDGQCNLKRGRREPGSYTSAGSARWSRNCFHPR
jgi:hypothetical protein